MMKKYNKLVRDKIPEIIESGGEKCVAHIATPEEYRTKLFEKVVEEATELSNDKNIKEVADVLEVLDAIIELEKYDKEEIQKIKKERREERGGFQKRVILDEC
jgi:predicted house-cleaning noncanonical NTP pyrophosphatase (MazG superfamily)